MKEFQALGLDISVINDKGETVELKQMEEDEEDVKTDIDEVEVTPVTIPRDDKSQIESASLSGDLTKDEYEEEQEDEFEEEEEDFPLDFDETMLEGDEE